MNEFEALIRDIARGRNLQFHPLTGPELAVLVRQYPEIPGEAIGNATELIVEALEGNFPITLGATVWRLIREQSEATIALDIANMSSQLELEYAEDDRYNRRVV